MPQRRHLVVPLLLALGACATHPTSSLDAFAERSANNSFEFFDRSVDPPETLVLPVVHDRQVELAACGAHALASVINYWRGPGAVAGQQIYDATPPADAEAGYSMAELLTLAQANGLQASAVRLSRADIIRELENGRPVLVPVRVPAVFVQSWSMPGANIPLVGLPASLVTTRVARVSEWTNLAMVNHYILIVGYERNETFVAVEPVMGFRTISFERLERYRRAFENAAIVFSAAPPPAAATAAAPQRPPSGRSR
ncbi:MAG: hypothetical protein ACREH4_06095 [Vitreimonas sp.]